MLINKKAQNITEYAIIISLVSAALISMTFYFKRGIQVIVKEPFDELGWFGAMPVDIENDGGLTNEEKAQKRKERIQEIGIEGIFDPKYGWTDSSSSRTIALNNPNIVTSAGGERRTNFNNIDISPLQESEHTVGVEYDQITPEP